MRSITAFLFSALLAISAAAQVPLEKPLAQFEQLTSQLKTATLVGEPIRVGETTVVPFAKVSFGLGTGGAAAAFGGGMSGKTIPLGILIVEGDDVRAEWLPEPDEKLSALQQIVQAILDRKVTFMTNGLNLGNATGTVPELAALISSMMGQTSVMVNGLNLGNMNAPRTPAAAPAPRRTEPEKAAPPVTPGSTATKPRSER